ncbi:AAA family ATPase [Azospirillum canadense]|uniref:AAA family ATPase n=1 Tax=Azospirillum canadense TaxID=403962 RepID=UPI002227A3FB|nr:AAA family ATPase [Azospirillum canadense]MCW2242406.1 class 3 adenylate cyclase/predicted ATPase [Azospirillum canadense]
MDVDAWLDQLGLARYGLVFRDNAIDADVLSELTDEDLAKLGVLLGHRKRLLKAIAALRTTPDGAGAAGPAMVVSGPERRQLTVMFVDLVGSTALSARLDPEEMHDLLRRYQNSGAGEIARCEGHVAKYMGDGILAYFGWPKSHENEGERAVRAGLAIVDVVSRLATPEATALAARVGIATGLVVVGDLIGEGSAREEAVVGETPNVAARLQGLAEPGWVVVAEATRRLIGGLFDVEDLGLWEVRGLAAPQRVFRALRPSRAATRFDGLHSGFIAPLVGRDAELGVLLRLWHHASRGEGQVVLLSGEAGIGKSRLIRALREHLAPMPLCSLCLQAQPHQTQTALWPFIENLENAAGFVREDDSTVRLAKLKTLVESFADEVAADTVITFAALLGVPVDGGDPFCDLTPQERKQRTFEALRHHLKCLVRHRPVLFMVEDLHWLDPTSTELLASMAEEIDRMPVLLVVTTRPMPPPPWSCYPHVTLLTLNHLDQHAAAALIERTANGRDLPAAVVKDILAKTEGVPLFIEELTKAVLEAGLLQEPANGPALAGTPAPLSIPASLHDSLVTRLDRLGSVKELAQIGAVIGREFRHELLEAVAGLEPRALDDDLERLLQSELVFRRGVGVEATYVFKHALVQDVAYATLLKSRRTDLHRRIAAAFDARFPEIGERQPELLAHHLTEGGSINRAVDLWLKAGRLASGRSANQEAIGHFRKALALLGKQEPTEGHWHQELETQIALSGPLIATKGFAAAEVETAYGRAEQLARRLAHRAHLATALRGLCYVHHVRARLTRVDALSAELLDMVRDDQDPIILADAHHARAFVLFHQGHFALAHEHIRIGRETLARIGAPERALFLGVNIAVFQQAYGAHIDWFLGHPERALRTVEDAVAQAQRLAHPFTVAVALIYAAMLHQFRREPDRARDWAELALGICTEHGFSYYRAWATILLGWVGAEAGDPVQGIRLVRNGIQDLRATGAELRMPFYLGILADLHRRAGELDQARKALSEAMTTARRTGERWNDGTLRLLAGELLLAHECGGASVAARCFRRALSIAQRQGARSLVLRASTKLASLAATNVRCNDARDRLASVYRLYEEGFDGVDLRDAREMLDALDKGRSPDATPG